MGVKHAGYRIICDMCNKDEGYIYESEDEEKSFNDALKRAIKLGYRFTLDGEMRCLQCRIDKPSFTKKEKTK